MVSSTTKKVIALAISLLVVVISLTGVALGAGLPTVTKLTSYTPGFAGDPGKMARDAAGNFFIADFWGKRIVKLDSNGANPVFMATLGRPAAVAVLPDNRLAVVMSKPQPYVAFYSQVTGAELSQFGSPAEPYYNPVAITVDAVGNIYVLDSGNLDEFNSATVSIPKVRVYSSAGAYLGKLGKRISLGSNFATGGTFKQPLGIAYEKALDQIVVVDSMTSRLQFFSSYGVDSACYTTDYTPPTVPSCFQSTKIIGGTAGNTAVTLNVAAKFYNPVDVAFEYNGASLYRLYVAERGKNSVAVVDGEAASYGLLRGYISYPEIKLPSSVFFENKTAGVAGVLYTANATSSASVPANILPMTVPAAGTSAVTITMSAVPAVSPTSPISVSGTTSPASSVVCSVNGVTVGTVSGTGSWTATGLVLQNGSNLIRCQSGSDWVSAVTEFYTPVTAPVIAITSPATGIYTKNATEIVCGTTNMANTTVKLKSDINATETTTLSDANNHWCGSVNLTEGINTISATGSKPGTNTSSPVTILVTSDLTPPGLNASFLNSGSTTNEAVQNVDGIVTELNLDTIEVNGVTVPPASLVTISTGVTYFSVPVTLVRGSNTVTVTATDRAGRSDTAAYSRTVTFNPEIPGLTVALPADNSFMAGVTSAAASGTAATTFTSVNAAGQSATVNPSTGAWNTTTNFTVSNSLSPYMFKASDGTNPEVTVKRTIANNASYKQLAITNPPADLAVKATPLIIEGVVDPVASPSPTISIDGNTCTVTLDAAFATNGKFSCVPPAFTEGKHVIMATAGTQKTLRHIILDTVKPDLSIQADSKSMPTTINGTIEPSAKISAITASLTGTGAVIIPISKITFDANIQSGAVAWHADLNGYTYDAISFTTMDPAGNETELAYEKGIPTGDIDDDGTVRLADALAALRHVAGTDPITDSKKLFNGDVGALVSGRASRDGSIDVTDSFLILNKAYGLMNF